MSKPSNFQASIIAKGRYFEIWNIKTPPSGITIFFEFWPFGIKTVRNNNSLEYSLTLSQIFNKCCMIIWYTYVCFLCLKSTCVLSWFFCFCFCFCFVLFCFVLFCFVLFCFVLFCFVLFCFVLFCCVLFCFVLFCFVFVFVFVLFCFVLCFVLFCLFVCFLFVFCLFFFYFIYFFFRISRNSRIGDKMIYASTKDSVKAAFTGLSLEFQAYDRDDLNYDQIREEVLKKA